MTRRYSVAVMRFACFVVTMLMLGLMAACGSAAHENQTPPAIATPAPVGPLLAYVAAVTQPGRTELVLHVYDIGARRELRSLSLPTLNVVLRPSTDEAIYVAGSDDPPRFEIRAWSGGASRVLYAANGPAPSIVASPDGAQLAFARSAETGASGYEVDLLTVATGEVRAIATLDHDPNQVGFRDIPVLRAWRSDGAGLLMWRDTGSIAGTWATLRFDGTVAGEMHRLAVPSTDGRWLVDSGVNDVGCVFGVQRLVIWDMDAAAASASVADPGRGIVFDRWSPDGQAVLYRQYGAKTPPNEGDCVVDYDWSTERTYLLSVHGGDPTPVADAAALLRDWNQGHDIAFGCQATSSGPGTPAPTPDVFGQCQSGGPVLDVDGQPVAKDVDRVLGFLDAREERRP